MKYLHKLVCTTSLTSNLIVVKNHHNLINVFHYESKEKSVVHMGCDQNKINQNVTFIIYLSS